MRWIDLKILKLVNIVVGGGGLVINQLVTDRVRCR